MPESEVVTLKFGTLKGWDVDESNDAAINILKRYHEIGTCFSVAAQKDTPEQKQLLVDLVSLPGMKVYLDWDDKFVSQEEAMKYIQDYRKAQP